MSIYNSTVLEPRDDDTDRHVDLVSFLGVLQKCKVELLPISWQPGLQLLGVGGTARVNQSQVNSQLGFAYKRMKTASKPNLTKAYRHVISEVRALTAPNIRDHPNVIDLVGVCWEIVGQTAVPVLVIPKAEYGDLRAFRESEIGRSLSFEARRSLCINVGAGLLALHSAGIIHCDLKPDNILVDRVPTDERVGPDEWVARVSDVGYARVGLSAEDAIHLPVSRPWTDPERHRNKSQVSTVRLMDMYSFGMVYLWLLLGDEISKHLDEDVWCFVPEGAPPTSFETWLKNEDGQFLETVKQLLENSAVRNDDEKAKLYRLFRGLLTPDHADRKQELDSLGLLPLHAHGPDLQRQGHGHLAPTELDHDDFCIAACHYRLCSSDYRVRTAIYEALVDRHKDESDTSCDICSKKAAFQLAVCHRLGLGVPRSEEKSLQCVSASQRTSDELEAEVHHIKVRALDSTYTESQYRSLFDQGLINWQNLPDRYHQDQVTSAAESTLKREISDMEGVLGSRHAAIFQLKDGLKTLMLEHYRTDEAEALQTEILEGLTAAFGENHPDVIAASEHLWRIHMRQDRLHQAAEDGERALSQRLKQQGPDHRAVWVDRNNLAETWRRLGRLKDAEDEQRQVVELVKNRFGENHWQTLSAHNMLAITLRDQGRIQESLRIQDAILENTKSAFGEGSKQYFFSLGELAITYDQAGKWSKAEAKYRQTIEGLQKHLGDKSKLTKFWQRNLRRAYLAQKDYEKDEEVQKDIIDRCEGRNEKDSYDSLSDMLFLADVYCESGKPAEALSIVSDVLDRQNTALRELVPESLSVSPPISLPVAGLGQGMRETLLHAPLPFSSFGDRVSTPVAFDALSVYQNSAIALVNLGHAGLARPIIADVLEGFTSLCGSGGVRTLEVLKNLAATYCKDGGIDAVDPCVYERRKERLDQYGSTDTTYLYITEELAKLNDLANRPKESLPLHEELVKVSKCTLGTVHPDTLRRAYALSTAYRQSSSWSKLETLNRDIFWSSGRRDIGLEELSMVGFFLEAAYWELGELSNAVNVIEQIVDDHREVHGSRHRTSLLFQTRLASGFFKMGQMERSMSIYREVTNQLHSPIEGMDYKAVVDALASLALAFPAKDKLEASKELLSSVATLAPGMIGAQHKSHKRSEEI